MSWDNVYSLAQFLTVFFAGLALVSGLIVNKRQATTISELQSATARQEGKNLELERGNIEAQKALEQERATRLEMEKSFTPRAIPLTIKKDGTTSVDALKPFAGIGMIVEYVPDAEAARAASNIAALAENAGWKLTTFGPNPELNAGRFDGVVVKPYSSDATAEKPARRPSEDEEKSEIFTNRATNALVTFLDSNNWEATKALGWKAKIPPNTVKISVGLKPLPYFQPKEWKKLREQMKEIERRVRGTGIEP